MEFQGSDPSPKTKPNYKLFLFLFEMQIFIKTITGSTFPIEVEPESTIGDLEGYLDGRSWIYPMPQLLIFAGQQLDDDSMTLADYGVQNESTLHLVMRLRGTASWLDHSELGSRENAVGIPSLRHLALERLGIDHLARQGLSSSSSSELYGSVLDLPTCKMLSHIARVAQIHFTVVEKLLSIRHAQAEALPQGLRGDLEGLPVVLTSYVRLAVGNSYRPDTAFLVLLCRVPEHALFNAGTYWVLRVRISGASYLSPLLLSVFGALPHLNFSVSSLERQAKSLAAPSDSIRSCVTRFLRALQQPSDHPDLVVDTRLLPPNSPHLDIDYYRHVIEQHLQL